MGWGRDSKRPQLVVGHRQLRGRATEPGQLQVRGRDRVARVPESWLQRGVMQSQIGRRLRRAGAKRRTATRFVAGERLILLQREKQECTRVHGKHGGRISPCIRGKYMYRRSAFTASEREKVAGVQGFEPHLPDSEIGSTPRRRPLPHRGFPLPHLLPSCVKRRQSATYEDRRGM